MSTNRWASHLFRFTGSVAVATVILVSPGLQKLATAAPAKDVFVSEFDLVERNFCGIAEVRSQGRFKLVTSLLPRGGSAFPHYFESAHGFHVHTNLANGKWFRQEYNAVVKDVHVVESNGDDTLVVAAKFSGREVLYSSDGTRLGHTTGTTTWRLLVDSQGTPDPEDDVLLDAVEVLDAGVRYESEFCVIVRNALL